MLDDTRQAALRRWYAQDHVLEEAGRLHADGAYEELEAYLHRTCLLPLGQHEALPEYMKDGESKPLFPDNLNPGVELEAWQDAIEIGWQVLEQRLGISHDDIHRAIAGEQDEEWKAFLASVEQRKRERGEG